MTAPPHDGTALRAYFIWDGEGRPHGRHEDHWFAAEALEARAAEPEVVVAVPAKSAAVKKAAPAKSTAAKKAAAPKKPAQPKAAAPKAPAETVVAAAALAAPRAARGTAKGARSAH